MGLVVEIEAVADELFELDFGRAFEAAVAAISAGAATAIAAAISTSARTVAAPKAVANSSNRRASARQVSASPANQAE